MLDSDKKMLVMHIVEKVFLPDVLVILSSVIGAVTDQAIYKHEYKKATGFDIGMPQIKLDLREAQTRLADAIATATKEYPPLPAKENNG